MSKKDNKNSWWKSAWLWLIGSVSNFLAFMFLSKGIKQQVIGVFVVGSIILSFGVGSYLVATNLFDWDRHSDLSPLFQQASTLLIGFMNYGKMSFLIGMILVGWGVNKNSRLIAKSQNKRTDKFATAFELEVSTRATLTMACNASCTVLVVAFWTGVMLLCYVEYVEVIAEVDQIVESMKISVAGYMFLNFILVFGLSYDVQNLRETYGRKPLRIRVKKRKIHDGIKLN